jgi:hypothetical protein
MMNWTKTVKTSIASDENGKNLPGKQINFWNLNIPLDIFANLSFDISQFVGETLFLVKSHNRVIGTTNTFENAETLVKQEINQITKILEKIQNEKI